MANKTINDLTASASAAAGDFVPVWVAASNVTRKVTKANFIGATFTGAGTIATGGNTLTVTGTSTINGSLVGSMTGSGTLATGGFTLTVPATGTAALRTGTPTAGNIASWASATNAQDGGIAVSDVARLGTAQTYTTNRTIAANLIVSGDNPLVLNSTGSVQMYSGGGTSRTAGQPLFRIVWPQSQLGATVIVTFTERWLTTTTAGRRSYYGVFTMARNGTGAVSAGRTTLAESNVRITTSISTGTVDFLLTDTADVNTATQGSDHTWFVQIISNNVTPTYSTYP